MSQGYLDFEIIVSDITLNEAQANYQKVCDIMKSDAINNKFIPKTIYDPQWTIRSTIGIDNVFGYTQIECSFLYDGNVIITDYTPAMKDVYYNIDIRCLTFWLQQNGWKTPEPSPTLIEYMKDFWKHQWETHLVNSTYLESKFGKRQDDTIVDTMTEDEN